MSRPQVQALDQANWTWEKSGYFIRWGPNSLDERQMTLLCFGAPSLLQGRLRTLKSVNSAMQDPFTLLVIIFTAISCRLDSTVWEVSDVFGKIEVVRVPHTCCSTWGLTGNKGYWCCLKKRSHSQACTMWQNILCTFKKAATLHLWSCRKCLHTSSCSKARPLLKTRYSWRVRGECWHRCKPVLRQWVWG